MNFQSVWINDNVICALHNPIFWFLPTSILSPVRAALRKSDVIKIAKPMNDFILFVHCWFKLVDWQAFFNVRVHHITAVVNDFETVFKFTVVTPVESEAAWLLACCRSDVFFYSILEAALSRGNIVVRIFRIHSLWDNCWWSFSTKRLEYCALCV